MPEVSDNQLPHLSPQINQFVENLGIYYESYGIPRVGGRMFGLFLVTTQPLSAEQIATLLNSSLSSVSTNVRALVANGWVEKVTYPGERTMYFRFAPSAWENVMERRRQGLAPLKAMAEQAQAALPETDPASAQLAGMAEWAGILIAHYEQLIAEWRQRSTGT